jgi:hypothetical protein
LSQQSGPAELWDLVVAQIEAEGFTARRAECANPGANGETNHSTHTGTVRDDPQPAQATRALVHERAHIAPGHRPELRTTRCRGRIEVEAEPAPYVACTEASTAAASDSLPYVAGWADGDTKMIAQTTEPVVTAAREITEAMSTVSWYRHDRRQDTGRARGPGLPRPRWSSAGRTADRRTESRVLTPRRQLCVEAALVSGLFICT